MLEKNSILIVDDESLIRRTTALLLEKAGFEVHTAASGKEGLDLARLLHPDLILLDILMPDVTGWDVLDRLRADPTVSAIPVLLFTGTDFAGADRRARAAGVAGTIRKPFNLRQMLEQINTVLGGGFHA